MRSPGRDVSHELRGTTPPNPSGVVLVLHGGGESGHEPVSWRKGAVLRMLPFAKAIERRAGGRLAVLRLKNRFHGWNDAERTPLLDARWALDEIRARYPRLPITLIGHSMGGRVALHLMGDPDVTTVVGLAPWIKDGDPQLGRAGLRVLLMHGDEDRITDPRLTSALSERLRSQGAEVRWRRVESEGHSMLRHPLTWHREVTDFVMASLLS